MDSSYKGTIMDPASIIEFLRPSKEWVVIDVGTGGGDTARAVAAVVTRVAAIDSSAKAIERCTAGNSEQGVSNIDAALMDAESLDFPDERFDAATCRLATHHFDNIECAVAEINRVTKMHAPFVLADRLCPDDAELSAFLHKLGKLRDSTFTTVLTESQWCEMLDRFGFKIVDQKKTRETIDVPKWLNHSPLNDEEKQAIYDAFASASPHVKAYFEVQFDGGRAVNYTDDKILLRALKTGKPPRQGGFDETCISERASS